MSAFRGNNLQGQTVGHESRPHKVAVQHGDGTNAAFNLIAHNQFDELAALLTGCHGNRFFSARDAKFGASLLHYASAKGHKMCMEILLNQSEVDKNAKDKAKGATPLHWAASMNQAFAVRQLLMHEADVNARDINGQPSLSWAAGNNSVAAIHELLLWGAAPTIVDRWGRTPLHWYVSNLSYHIFPLTHQLGQRLDLLLITPS